MDFNKSREIAFEALSSFYTCKNLDRANWPSTSIKNSNKLCEIWRVNVEIQKNKKYYKDYVFYIGIKADFPLTLPEIYINNEDFKIIFPIPHLDDNHFLCTFNTEEIIYNSHNPAGLVIESLKRAIDILEAGINGTNLHEFEEEFLSYWTLKFSEIDKIDNTTFLSLCPSDEIKTGNFEILLLEKPLGQFNRIIFNKEKQIGNFIKVLENSNIQFKIVKSFFIGEIDFKEIKFPQTNSELVEFIRENKSSLIKEYKSYLNSNNETKFVLFAKEINTKPHLLGFIHTIPGPLPSSYLRNRREKLSNYNILSQSNAPLYGKLGVVRIKPEEYSENRLELRTSGLASANPQLLFNIAGLGSIGSNLLFFLRSFGSANFNLIDPDMLELENINRHFLGLTYTGMPKAIALKNFLENHFPHKEIIARKSSIIQIIEEEPDFINNSQYLFISIGSNNIEQYIGEAISSGKITVPTFFLWVEPYALGGHLLYLHSNDKTSKYNDYFDSDSFFKFNLILKDEYLKNNPKLRLREAGCQMSFTPFSQGDIIHYLSSIYPVIRRIIASQEKNNLSYSWSNDKNLFTILGIEPSPYSGQIESYLTKENKL